MINPRKIPMITHATANQAFSIFAVFFHHTAALPLIQNILVASSSSLPSLAVAALFSKFQ